MYIAIRYESLNVSNIIGKIRKIKVLLEIVTRKYYLTTDIRHITPSSGKIRPEFWNTSEIYHTLDLVKFWIHNTSCTRKSLKVTYARSKTNRLGANLFNKSLTNAITNKQPFSFMKAIRPTHPLCTHGTTFQPFNTLENTLFHLQEISSPRPRLLTETLLQFCSANSRSQLKLLVLVYTSGQSS